MKFKNKLFLLKVIVFLILVPACTRVIDTSKLIPTNPNRILVQDNYELKGLLAAIDNSILYFEKLPLSQIFNYGEEEYTTTEVIASMQLFKSIIKTSKSNKKFIKQIKKKFTWLKSPGRKKDSRVLFTGYFEPMYQVSLEYSADYPVPALSVPTDLKVLDLGLFRKNLVDHTIVYFLAGEQILPYHSRKEIMEFNILKDKAQPLAWFQNAIDLFFLQVQGSGLGQTPDGKLVRLGYAGSNGLNYSSIGKILIKDKIIPKEKMSMNAIRSYLEQNPKAIKDLLYQNESYVFFRLLDLNEGPYGSIGVPVTAERTLATDYRLFPKGALTYISTSQPDCENDESCETHAELRKFMVIQDTGGAIRSFGRADIFWGRGELAKNKAGYMQHLGDLFVLVAKKEYLLSP